MSVVEIEAMLSLCLYQRFFIFVTSFDCDTLITNSRLFVLISDNVLRIALMCNLDEVRIMLPALEMLE